MGILGPRRYGVGRRGAALQLGEQLLQTRRLVGEAAARLGDDPLGFLGPPQPHVDEGEMHVAVDQVGVLGHGLLQDLHRLVALAHGQAHERLVGEGPRVPGRALEDELGLVPDPHHVLAGQEHTGQLEVGVQVVRIAVYRCADLLLVAAVGRSGFRGAAASRHAPAARLAGQGATGLARARLSVEKEEQKAKSAGAEGAPQEATELRTLGARARGGSDDGRVRRRRGHR